MRDDTRQLGGGFFSLLLLPCNGLTQAQIAADIPAFLGCQRIDTRVKFSQNLSLSSLVVELAPGGDR